MQDANDHVIDLIFGRWRSRTLYAGVELGVFEVVGRYPTHGIEVADTLVVDTRYPENELVGAVEAVPT
jgi:hypothetical protein